MLDEQNREMEATAAPINLKPEMNCSNVPSKNTQLPIVFFW
jgi:hypothetical protein